MNCLGCSNEMKAMRTPDTDHDGTTAGWSYEYVCRDCTPDYYRRFNRS